MASFAPVVSVILQFDVCPVRGYNYRMEFLGSTPGREPCQAAGPQPAPDNSRTVAYSGRVGYDRLFGRSP